MQLLQIFSASGIGTWITGNLFNCSLQQLSNCLDDIFYWLTKRRLKLIADKTELILIGMQRQCDRINHVFPVHVYHCLVSMLCL